MGAAPCFGPSPIDHEMMDEIERAAKRSAIGIPKNYTNEKERIIMEMKRSSPKPYQNLLYSEYPDKNESKVNELALKNVSSKASKREISDEINRQIGRKVEEKTADQPELARVAIRKAVEKAVEEAVDKAVDASIEAIQNKENSN